MFTPHMLYESEEYIKAWHRPKASKQGSHYVYTQRPWRMLLMLLRLLVEVGDTASKAANRDATPAGEPIEVLLERGTVTTLAVLQAVAGGELKPRVALHMLRATMSTLALFEAVAWGEISPNAAASLLGGRT